MDFFWDEFVFRFCFAGGVSDGNDAQGNDIMGEFEDVFDDVDDRGVWRDGSPNGAESEGFDGEKDVFSCGSAIVNPKRVIGGGTIFFGVAANDDGSAGVAQHFGIREGVAQSVEQCAIVDSDEFPGLAVHARGGSHTRFDNRFELIARNGLARVLPDT